ncbi:hypothetical protein A1OE_90 [Candidatus Endolissoclinum faulkneri L2]|uniref:Uncharacterized protein n=1 Tax=Candidatus Endolissoclinum faulkneri L2 TaxID=1193729 RepID=K7ZC50_9PROT|nr:hypothetical protein A1OE_90 [Candidatus Endolissoclinum faulkneri L2]
MKISSKSKKKHARIDYFLYCSFIKITYFVFLSLSKESNLIKH